MARVHLQRRVETLLMRRFLVGLTIGALAYPTGYIIGHLLAHKAIIPT